MIPLNWAAASDTGRVRTANEDSFWAGDGLFLVADGLGGHAAGEVASAIAVDRLRQLTIGPATGLATPPAAAAGPGGAAAAGLTEAAVESAIQAANADILRDGAEHPERSGMGTTLAGLACIRRPDPASGQRWLVFHLGDSRVYRYFADELAQLTVDHSAVQEMVAAGCLTAEDARHHPRRNIVTRSLGQKPIVEPEFSDYEIVPGERFMICSDGLSEELQDDQIAELLRVHPDPREAASALIESANQAGGRDNITVVVLAVPADI